MGQGTTTALSSLVLPTYNPGLASVERTWLQVGEFLRGATDRWEVVYVCDGCTDGSGERLQELARFSSDRARVIRYARNRGKGYAVRRGLRAAVGQWRVFADFDLAYGFDDVLRVQAALRAGADLAIASRTHPDSRILLPPRLQGYLYRRHLQSRVLSRLIRLLLPLTQRDTQAGLKGISARTARAVLPHLRSRGFELDCELLTACVRLGLTIAEVPVCVRYESSASSTSWGNTLRMIWRLWRIRRAWRNLPTLDRPLPAQPAEVATPVACRPCT